MPDTITRLARTCAEKGLDLRAARALFDALYVADVVLICGGNRTAAAARAGLDRSYFYGLEQRQNNERPPSSAADGRGRRTDPERPSCQVPDFAGFLAPAVGIEPTTN